MVVPSRGEKLRRSQNLRSVFILLFLNVAFFLLEHQDPEKYVRMFRFDWDAVLRGEIWRLVSWQFTAAGQGWLEALALFVTLLILYMMGSAVEDEWGTRHFAMLFVLSTGGSAAVAAWLSIPLLGTYFVYYTLLFVYATAFPQQTLYLFGVIPVRVRLIAIVSFAALVYGVFAGGLANIAALVGSGLAYFYYLTQRARVVVAAVQQAAAVAAAQQHVPRAETTAMQNAARYAAIKQSVNAAAAGEMHRLIAQCDREMTQGVNICPPADYKPEATDGYCIRCEGFAECSARYLRSRLPATAAGIAAATTAPTPPPAAEPAPLG
ncbi:MAG TPA: rhomboid family intramembrane serine protease [Thermoanaerobaculia bacterium]|nr:rhomboid family intramembrane serine protease [Thermoanaerobaculia bacterium]